MSTPEQVIRARMTKLQPAVEEYHRLLAADEALANLFGPLSEAPPKTNTKGGQRYSADTKAAAVARFAEVGTLSAVAKEFDVAISTLKGWIKQARKSAEPQPTPEPPVTDEPREVTTDV